jgi:holo-[acyl-carrier protein] synthase
MTDSAPVVDQGPAVVAAADAMFALAGQTTQGRPVLVGVDVAEVSETRRSLECFGERYVRRLFTPHEAACCRSSHDPTGYAVGSLAARFAAKEAALKVLRPTGPRPSWRSIEVRRHANGSCDLILSGAAARLAAEHGVDRVGVSLTHEGPVAAAVVVASTAGRS